MEIVILVLLVLGGPGTLAGTPIWAIRHLRFLARAVPADGVVTACEGEKNTEPGTRDTYRLTVRYRLPDGREATLTEGGRARTAAGALVKVLYDPARPERGRLGFARRDIWPKAAFLLFFGAVCTALLAGYWHRLLP
ncbi:DUF3592 domain-containing protein [Actinomadura scrupuli]|uniref:DUF3592 domain-containing protein n=1 Tax=Actinomadura scrupuli TaxID=559629 RepID=UPI003D977FAA